MLWGSVGDGIESARFAQCPRWSAIATTALMTANPTCLPSRCVHQPLSRVKEVIGVNLPICGPTVDTDLNCSLEPCHELERLGNFAQEYGRIQQNSRGY